MTFYERNLPHWQPEGAAFFVTWRLFGSLPLQKRTARNGCATGNLPKAETPGERFVRLDRALERTAIGPHWLRIPSVADRVTDLILKGEKELGYFSLHAFVIMPNHVHLLMAPKQPLERIMNGIKGSTAHAANTILGRIGKPFWQDESFDHWVRTEKEFGNIFRYIEWNPVSAGLARRPEDWAWSSARIGVTQSAS
jgi:REP element-mobilizing transposase RayT